MPIQFDVKGPKECLLRTSAYENLSKWKIKTGKKLMIKDGLIDDNGKCKF